MREVIGLIGKSLASGVVLREMLHLMSELIGLNRGRIVLTDPHDNAQSSEVGTSRICFAYGLTQAEMTRGVHQRRRHHWPSAGHRPTGVGARH